MNKLISTGMICLKNDLNIEFYVCKITYILNEDESFKYIFEPNYNVISLLGSDIFQGIPGLNLDLKRKQYIRTSLPVFISERVPQKNREDFNEILSSLNMDYMNHIDYLIKTKMKYSGDNFYVKEFENKQKIIINNISNKNNTADTIKIILNNITKGNDVIINNLVINDKNRKDIYQTLIYIYQKAYNFIYSKQKEGIKNTNHIYKGRKPIYVDKLEFLTLQDKINKKEISIKDACLKLGISIDKYYRYKKSLD
jgi:hypothetical protein